MLFLASCSSSKKSASSKSLPPSSLTINSDGKAVIVNSDADGSSMENAIIIDAPSETEGIHKEYEWLKEKYPDHSLIQQSLLHERKKSYDAMKIKTKQGDVKTIYFDITKFFGKGFGF